VGEGRKAVACSNDEPASAEAESVWMGGSVAWTKGNGAMASGQSGRIPSMFEAPLSATSWLYDLALCGSSQMA
jgi:hypothetical protein